MDTEVFIVGAGSTGLVLALWLARLRIRVRIVDKAADPGTTSRALAVQARTLELYPCWLETPSAPNPCLTSGRAAPVVVMETAEHRNGEDTSLALARSSNRLLLAQSLVRACCIVEADELVPRLLRTPVIRGRLVTPA